MLLGSDGTKEGCGSVSVCAPRASAHVAFLLKLRAGHARSQVLACSGCTLPPVNMREKEHARARARVLSGASVVISRAFFLFFPCSHIIHIKNIFFFFRRSKRQRNFPPLFFTFISYKYMNVCVCVDVCGCVNVLHTPLPHQPSRGRWFQKSR
jgi:hypothetical protein